MNFYELFEASKDKEKKHTQDVDIADPKVAYELHKARTRYSYAQSDLEAFVKMVQDEEEADQKEFDKLEKDTERQESEIKDLEHQARINSAEINKLEKENDILNAKETGYEKKINAMTAAEAMYKNRIETLQNDLTDLERRLKNVPDFIPKAGRDYPELPAPTELEKPEDKYVSPYDIKNFK